MPKVSAEVEAVSENDMAILDELYLNEFIATKDGVASMPFGRSYTVVKGETYKFKDIYPIADIEACGYLRIVKHAPIRPTKKITHDADEVKEVTRLYREIYDEVGDLQTQSRDVADLKQTVHQLTTALAENQRHMAFMMNAITKMQGVENAEGV